MQNHSSTVRQDVTRAHAIAEPLQLVSAFVLGDVIVYAAGFLNTAAVHDAAHDTRHSQGFPCH